MKKNGLIIIFWGAAWGLSEAVIGYLLHIVALTLPGIPGLVMFPIAFYFMRRVYLATGEIYSIFSIAFVAASIKFMDFLIPGHMALRIVNPALSILYEGLAVAVVTMLVVKNKKEFSFLNFFSMGILWRGIFLLHLSFTLLFGLPATIITDGLYYSLKFLLFESLINGILIYGYYKLEKGMKPLSFKFQYDSRFSFALLFVAILASLKL